TSGELQTKVTKNRNDLKII
ncbi:hypothetical protein DMN91_005973, partial [Ooceraea biroi]